MNEQIDSLRKKKIYKTTLIGSVGNLLLLLFKFIAGILGNSAAMIADAIHSLSDFITDIIVLVFVNISNKPQDRGHDFGHGKYETLATAIIGIILFFVGLGIFYNGVTTIVNCVQGKSVHKPGILALSAALLSVLIKEILYQYTAFVAKKIQSQALKANAWHHRSDSLSSIGVAVGIGGAILLGPKWYILDPIAATLVSLFIIKIAFKLVIPCIDELMEKSLSDSVEQQITQALTDVDGVYEPHNLRTRKIGNAFAVDVHVRMNGDITLKQCHEATLTMEQNIRKLLGDKTFISIHVEPLK